MVAIPSCKLVRNQSRMSTRASHSDVGMNIFVKTLRVFDECSSEAMPRSPETLSNAPMNLCEGSAQTKNSKAF